MRDGGTGATGSTSASTRVNKALTRATTARDAAPGSRTSGCPSRGRAATPGPAGCPGTPGRCRHRRACAGRPARRGRRAGVVQHRRLGEHAFDVETWYPAATRGPARRRGPPATPGPTGPTSRPVVNAIARSGRGGERGHGEPEPVLAVRAAITSRPGRSVRATWRRPPALDPAEQPERRRWADERLLARVRRRRHPSGTRHESCTGTQPEHADTLGGPSDRPAVVAADGEVDDAGGDRDRVTTARPARRDATGRTGAAPGHRSGSRCRCRCRTPRSCPWRTSVAPAALSRCTKTASRVRHVIGQQQRAPGRGQSGGGEGVLDRERQAGQRAFREPLPSVSLTASSALVQASSDQRRRASATRATAVVVTARRPDPGRRRPDAGARRPSMISATAASKSYGLAR